MKLSVSLPDEAVDFLDRYARSRGYDSRSAVVHRAIRLLQAAELGRDYADAWAEWTDAGNADDWEPTAGDGLAGT